jgi:3-isopropylmalate/(R)-2-methylmalate dehydratase small subunit
VIAESFAEIFFGNATTLGMPCVTVTRDKVQELGALTEKQPELKLVIDLQAQTIAAGSLTVPFTIKPGARDALVRGEWDPIGQLLDGKPQVGELSARLPYLHF